MLVQITKRSDGAGVLRCLRADGSVTWQKQERHGVFFALHDLTHFAVESTLELRGGFFGLIAAGWEIEDTTGKGNRGALPNEAIEVEHIVGMLDAERASGAIFPAEDFHPWREISGDELQRIRERRAELFAQWAGVEPSESLELDFPD